MIEQNFLIYINSISKLNYFINLNSLFLLLKLKPYAFNGIINCFYMQFYYNNNIEFMNASLNKKKFTV